MSAISASSASTSRARNSTRSRWAAAPSNEAAIGKIVGPGFVGRAVPDAIERIVEAYLELRRGEEEPFIEVYRRVGEQPFKEKLYAAA